MEHSEIRRQPVTLLFFPHCGAASGAVIKGRRSLEFKLYSLRPLLVSREALSTARKIRIPNFRILSHDPIGPIDSVVPTIVVMYHFSSVAIVILAEIPDITRNAELRSCS